MKQLLVLWVLSFGRLSGSDLLLPLPRTIITDNVVGTTCLPASSLDNVARGLQTADRDVLATALDSIKDAFKQRWPSGSKKKAATSTTVTTVEIQVQQPSVGLTRATDETYNLTIEVTRVTIQAVTAYGARHALTTLLQLVVLQKPGGLRDEEDRCGAMPSLPLATIRDAPRFRHRGVILDTARHFLPPDVMKRTIEGMAFVKLNVLHWHLTDSNSFPFVPPSHPELGVNGSYGKDQRYHPEDVRALVDFARRRGVRVVVEVDTPGHFYAWGLGMPGIVMCNTQTYHTDAYCSGPPCGYLKVESSEAVQVVKDVLQDIMAVTIDDTLHIGGDEINPTCYGGPERTAKLFSEYATKLQDTLKAKGRTAVAWADSVLQYKTPFDTNTTILHAWWDPPPSSSGGAKQGAPRHNASQVVKATNLGYRVIDSSSDALYLDCGTGGYMTGGRSWCDPYKTWQTVYLHEPTTGVSPSLQHLVEGGEVAAWGEKIDADNVDTKVWPRAAALAERLWSSVGARDVMSAQARLRRIRGAMRLLFGIRSTPLMPQSCDDEDGPGGASQCDTGYSTYFVANIPACEDDTLWRASLVDGVTGEAPSGLLPGTSLAACVGTPATTTTGTHIILPPPPSSPSSASATKVPSPNKEEGGDSAPAPPSLSAAKEEGYNPPPPPPVIALHVTLSMQDEDPWSPVTQCNGEGFSDADMVSITIASGFDDPLQYLEVAFNPNGAAMIARVNKSVNASSSSPWGSSTTTTTTTRELLPCQEARDDWGLSWDVVVSQGGGGRGWNVSTVIPLPLLTHYLGAPSDATAAMGGGEEEEGDGSRYFRVNVFRVDVATDGHATIAKDDDQHHDGGSDQGGWFPYHPDTSFSSWQPTFIYPPSLSVPTTTTGTTTSAMDSTKYMGVWRLSREVVMEAEQPGGREGGQGRRRTTTTTALQVEIPPN